MTRTGQSPTVLQASHDRRRPARSRHQEEHPCVTSPMSRLTAWLRPTAVAHAHCDIPCGIYDRQLVHPE
jgi:hypothetical protein